MFQPHMRSLADLMWLPGLVIGFTFHELGHALVAYWMGDRGDLTRNRLTINPMKHVPWLGLVVFVLLGFGWAKPVRFRPAAFKHPNLGSLLVSLAGVTANLLVAVIFLILAFAIAFIGGEAANLMGLNGEALFKVVLAGDKLTPMGALVGSLAGSVVNVNVMLALFNLLPIPGFDGFHALVSLWWLVSRHQVPDQDRCQAGAAVAFEEGNYMAHKGQMPQAVSAWRRAVSFYPSFYAALYNLGLAYLRAGQRNAAMSALACARLAGPTDGDKQQAAALLAQAGWNSDESPPLPTSVADLPELCDAPLSPIEEASAGRRRLLKVVGISAGAIAGVGAYAVLITLLAFIAIR